MYHMKTYVIFKKGLWWQNIYLQVVFELHNFHVNTTQRF